MDGRHGPGRAIIGGRRFLGSAAPAKQAGPASGTYAGPAMAREGIAPFAYVSAASGVGGGLGDPFGLRICCGGRLGGTIVAFDDRGERRRGHAVLPRATVKQEACVGADVAHGPNVRRAGFGGARFGPVQCPHFSPPFHTPRKKGCRRRHACGSLPRLHAGLASAAAFGRPARSLRALDSYAVRRLALSSLLTAAGALLAPQPSSSFHI
jgi:hypothetical protein